MALVINHEQAFHDIIALSDDGTEEDITISTIVVPEYEGNKLKNHFIKNENPEPITIYFENDFPANKDKLTIQLFFNPINHKIYQLLEDIRKIVVSNPSKISFNPIYTFDLNFETADYIEYLKNQGRCICGKKYCEDFNFVEGKGNNVIIEAIRQKCVYHKSFEKSRDKNIYFEYMDRFDKECRLNDISIACSDRILASFDSKLPGEVNECFLYSFDYRGGYQVFDEIYKKCKKNTVLDESFYFLSHKLKKALPILRINGFIYFGSWKKEFVEKALCEGVWDKFDFCSKGVTGMEDIKPDNPNNNNPSDSFKLVLVLTIIFVVLALSILIFIFWKIFSNKRGKGKTIVNNSENKELEVKIENLTHIEHRRP
jgi:hypothetical protein